MSEVSILKTVDHPNVIKYFGSYVDGHYLCIVMEYAEGGDLQ
jgi:serine/threonine protein kinase